MSNKKKNDNGNGSIKLRSDGRMEGRITIDGVTKSVYGKTETEVKRKLKQYRTSVAQGYYKPQKITLNEYIERWLNGSKLRELELGKITASTYDKLESAFIYQIKPYEIGRKQMGAITVKEIEDFFQEKANPKNPKNKPIASSGIKRINCVLAPCFKKALREKVINCNPLPDVILPSEETHVVKTKEMIIMDEQERIRFKEVCLTKTSNGFYRYRFGLYFLFLLNTGMRAGELLALEFSDIDLNNRIIRINKGIESNVKNRDKNATTRTKNVLTNTKTPTGKRTIPMNDAAYFYICELINENKRRSIKTNFVASSATGTRATHRNLLRTFYTIVKKANIRNCSLHGLRHTFCSTLIKKKADLYVISPLMGHKSTKITEEVYAHVLEEEKAKAIKLLDII